MGFGARRAVAGVAILIATGALTGCTNPVESATDALEADLATYPGVEYIYSGSREAGLFEEAFSSISIDVAHDITAVQLDELVSAWRFGVDDITGRWRLSITRPGGAEIGTGYDDFSVAGVRSVAELTALARYWYGVGESTESAGVSFADYSESSDGSIRLEYPAAETSDLHGIFDPLAEAALGLPGRFQWSVDVPVPSGLISLGSENILPDADMLDILAAVAGPNPPGHPGPIQFWANEYSSSYGPVNEPRLTVTVNLDPPGFAEFEVDEPDLDLLAQRVLADPVWAIVQGMADDLPTDERTVVLNFSIAGHGIAHLDPWQCSTRDSEDIYGPLTYDLWQHWLRGGARTPDGSTATTCQSHK